MSGVSGAATRPVTPDAHEDCGLAWSTLPRRSGGTIIEPRPFAGFPGVAMVKVRTLTRAAIVVLMAAAPAIWYACVDGAPDAPAGPAGAPSVTPRGPLPDLRGALAAQRRHTDALLEIPGVVGTAVTGLADGRASVLILLERPGIADLPQMLDGVPVTHRVTGRLMAFSDPTRRQRPAPAGFSVGHPAVTAGTIGARVRDALGRVYILSNNHVLAHGNDAALGDPQYQPGPFDGGTAADEIATLTEYQAIAFSGTANNLMDAAIALSSTDLLDNATPSDDGYGMPNAAIYGDADGDGLFDDRNALLGLNVQKYGRTTRLTHGQITGVNATARCATRPQGPSVPSPPASWTSCSSRRARSAGAGTRARSS